MASKSYLDLRERVEHSADPFSLFSECSEYIQGILFDGMSGVNEFYQAYCAYAFAMGVEFKSLSDTPMCVQMDTSNVGNVEKGIGGISFLIDPIVTFKCFKSEFEVLFCISHEVKHLLLKHLIKYKDLYKEETTGVILNLCNDVEVNESLKGELCVRGYSSSVPSSCFDMNSVSKILGGTYTRDYLYRVYREVKNNKGYDSLSDMLYKFFDVKCKDVLGYDIENILYHVQVAKSSFKVELFNTARSGCSSVFKIKDQLEAKRFCTELAKYLKMCMFPMIVVGGGFGSDSADKEESSSGSEDQGSGKSRESSSQKKCNASTITADEMIDSGTLLDVLEAVEQLKEVYLDGVCSKNQKSRGVGSGGKASIELKDFRKTIPWQVILKRYLISLSQVKVPTKRRINRRQPQRLELSGAKYDPVLSLIVAFDESGSISNNEFSYFVAELTSIAVEFKCDIHLYRFTSCVEEYVYIKQKDVLRTFKNRKFTSYRYNGGTSFQPVFKAVQDNKRIKLNRSVLVMFTDGFGEHHVDFGRVKNRLWVVTGSEGNNYGLSCEESKKNIYPVVPARV